MTFEKKYSHSWYGILFKIHIILDCQMVGLVKM